MANAFKFSFLHMEQIAAFGASVPDLCEDDDIKAMHTWDDYIHYKNAERAAIHGQNSRYTTVQTDFKDHHTRDLSTFPPNGFLEEAFTAVLDDTPSDVKIYTCEDQVKNSGLQWDSAYKLCEMYHMGQDIPTLKNAVNSTDPDKAIKTLFDKEFALYQTFASHNGIKITGITMPAFKDVVAARDSDAFVVFDHGMAVQLKPPKRRRVLEKFGI